eukprot:CAMPEP_0113854300 /NCGR_PEP_ID=MMETSP0372-20130328/7209_1 /TAXON_ID=340204 /ORGANISM="Lankesteria abbotti" /LENGTH=67 /DNA_ID=CAMNT_0000827385 /DNA_START=29 /DNA_END=232 /DNA_ORIENTATION=+ /assembly_acc=CAM_ASM_000359
MSSGTTVSIAIGAAAGGAILIAGIGVVSVFFQRPKVPPEFDLEIDDDADEKKVSLWKSGSVDSFFDP